MKRRKLFLGLLCVTTLTITSVGCSNNENTAEQDTASSTVDGEANSEEITTFVDSLGREVEVPSNIERIAPSGPLAQVILYTLCPDKLAGLGSELSDSKYVDSKYQELPIFGNFYADTLNLETVMKAEPQVVIDVGEEKSTGIDDMESIQDKTGIPSVFIQMDLSNAEDAYRTLGKLVGEEERAEKLAQYAEETIVEAKQLASTISDDKQVEVYYGRGDDGLSGVVKGTQHSEVIETINALNVVVDQESTHGGAADISMEQLMLWQPDVIIFDPDSIYADIYTRTEWSGLEAVKNKKVYEVPEGPYNWMSSPPSVNRLMGVKWLGNLLYPDVYQYDMVKETQEFYHLFYQYDLTEDEANELLKNSTFLL